MRNILDCRLAVLRCIANVLRMRPTMFGNFFFSASIMYRASSSESVVCVR